MLNTDSKRLAVDFPEDVKIPIEHNQIATPAWSRSKIKFSYCRVSRTIKLDRDRLLFHIKKNMTQNPVKTYQVSSEHLYSEIDTEAVILDYVT